ncbi:SLATT domain-containing protein [Kibdelosporangium philippinense]|uniref:SLATT domain-containing protein n=1 Tax=Kibdelosporangium philippinense TaxID=211113 RepID=A0ABS8ZG68_9PSEU|nr:SLATT domain-containing protein [Kibdelosporangium philippinense]MCE7006043.1 SLATT domain-containing protein [Kibdelosporangium philippinense]
MDSGGDAGRFEFVKSEVDGLLRRFRKRRTRDKRKAFGLQMATVTLSATISVLLGLRNFGGAESLLANIALALGALIAVLAAADAFFGHRDLWILRTRTVRDLEELSRDLAYYESSLGTDPPARDEVDGFFDRLGEIVKRDSEDWGRLRTPMVPNQ